MRAEDSSLAVILVVGPDSTSLDLGRSLASALESSAVVSVVLPKEFLTGPTLHPSGFDRIHYHPYEPQRETVSAGVNRAFDTLVTDYFVVIFAGTMCSATTWDGITSATKSGTPDILSQQTTLVRPTSEMSDGDLKELRQGTLRLRADTSRLSRQESSDFLVLRRSAFHVLRGLDEDISQVPDAIDDYIQRALKYGYKRLWNTRFVDVFKLAPKLNAKIVSQPLSVEMLRTVVVKPPIFRNLRAWKRSSAVDGPLVSVVISTYNRDEYLSECIHSVLAQTFEDFELILVDDGSTDSTPSIVAAFADPRVRYFHRENAGISAARNFATRQARGAFIAVHDDDDIMLPWRLERQLEALRPGDHGSFGVSIHFDNETGDMNRLVHRKFNLQTALRYGHNPTHPTWLIRKDVFERFGYDETLKSGVDNNIALRMVRSGVQLRHTGESLILRRVHGGQITRTAGEIQNASARMSQRLLKFANGLAEDPTKAPTVDEWLPSVGDSPFEAEVRPYLPDHLVQRTAVLHSNDATIDLRQIARSVGQLEYYLKAGSESQQQQTIAEVRGVTLAGLVTLQQSGVDHELKLTEEPVHDSEVSGAASVIQDWVDTNFIRDQQPGAYRILLVDLTGTIKNISDLAGDLVGFSCHAERDSSSAQAFASIILSSHDAVRHYRQLISDVPGFCRTSILSIGPKVLPTELISMISQETDDR